MTTPDALPPLSDEQRERIRGKLMAIVRERNKGMSEKQEQPKIYKWDFVIVDVPPVEVLVFEENVIVTIGADELVEICPSDIFEVYPPTRDTLYGQAVFVARMWQRGFRS